MNGANRPKRPARRKVKPVSRTTDCLNDPDFARELFRSSLLFLPGVAVSTFATVAIVGLEIALVLSSSKVLLVVGVLLGLFHASYMVNTMMQARIALADLDRCLRGLPPRRFTTEVMAHAIRSGKTRRSFLGTLMVIGTPFFPVATWAIGEILALTEEEVRQRLADLSADDHHVSAGHASLGRDVVRASKRVVLGQARMSVLAVGV